MTTNKSNKTNKTNKTKRFSIALAIAIMLATTPAVLNTPVVPKTTVYADTGAVVAYDNNKPVTFGNIKLEVKDGAVTEYVNNEEVKLTKSMVAYQAAIDTNSGATYVLWQSGSLYLYSYKYSGKNCSLVKIDSGVSELKTDGYYSGDTKHAYLSDEEVRNKLGISNGNNTNGNNTSGNNTSGNNTNGNNTSGNNTSGNNTSGNNTNGNNTSGNNTSGNNTNGNNTSGNTTTSTTGVKLVGDSTVIYTVESKDIVISTGEKVSEVAETDGVVYIRYASGTIKKCKAPTMMSTTVSLDTVTTTSTSFYKENGKVVGYYESGIKKQFNSNNSSATTNNLYVSIQNGKATLFVFENGNISKQIDLLDKGADGVWKDSNGTYYIRSGKVLYIYNYSVQKDNTKVILVPIEKNLKDVVESDGLFRGYTTETSNIMQNPWTLEQVKTAVYLTSNNTTTTSNTTENKTTTTTTSKTKYVVKHKKGSKTWYLKDTKTGKVVDKFEKGKNVIYFHGWKYSYKSAWWNEKGNLILRNGKITKVLNRKNGKGKTISSKTKTVITDEKAKFAMCVETTNGKFIDIRNK